MNSYLITPHESIYKQLDQILELTSDFKEYQLTLEDFVKRVTLSQAALPFLQQECEIFFAEIHTLQNKIQNKLLLLQSHESNLKDAIAELVRYDAKIANNTHKIDELITERKKLINVLRTNQGLLQNKSEVYFARVGAKKAAEFTGLGIEIIEAESHCIDDQASSIELKLNNKNNKAKDLSASQKDLEQKAMTQVTTLQPSLIHLTQSLERLKMQVVHIAAHVAELEELTQLSNKNNLYRAALFGDVEEIKKHLFSLNSPVVQDEFGYKPVYYACRAGHLQAALFLLDLTQLSDDELVIITNKLPKCNKVLYDALYAALQSNRASYDYLWSEQRSYGDNIIRVFLDYFEPELLLSLPGISKEFVVSFWHREHIKFAKDIVAIFNLFEDNIKQSHKTCQDIMNGKWQTFFDLYPNTTDTLARRLHYVKNKLEPRLKNELDESMVKSIKSKLNQQPQAGKTLNQGFLSFIRSPFGFLNQSLGSTHKTPDNGQVGDQPVSKRLGITN